MISLRPYQKDAVDKLSDYNNVLIADEMGLGKTVTAVELDKVRRSQCDLAKARENGFDRNLKTLVVAPLTGVVDSWVSHFNTWNPDLSVVRINPKKRDQFIESVWNDEADVFVCHWEGLRLMPELADEIWAHVIADEVHKAKNRKAKQTKALKSIKRVKFKSGLTGTPMVNDPSELWSILHWLYNDKKTQVGFFGEDAKYLSSYWRFYNTFVDYFVIQPYGYHKILGPKNESKLMNMVEPFYIRREKKEALPDLPDKVYSTYKVDLTANQQKQYNQMAREMIAWLDSGQPLVAPVVIAQLQRLQQFAIATPELSTVTHEEETEDTIKTWTTSKVTALTKPSSKLDMLVEIISDTNKQVVVFSQFTMMIELVYKELTDKGFNAVQLTGKTPQNKRTEIIRHFQSTAEGSQYYDPELAKTAPQVFLANIKAGGTGIDLFASDTVIFLDRDWSPANNSQAEDRLHRSGQKNSVQIIDIIAKGTVDLGRKQKLDKKASWIKSVLSGGEQE